jgi:hypothetical protein
MQGRGKTYAARVKMQGQGQDRCKRKKREDEN